MGTDEFVHEVKERSGSASTAQTVRVTHATFTTLAERISGDECHQLAATLPTELGAPLAGRSAPAEGFGLDEFMGRVASRAGVDETIAYRLAQAVFEVLRDAAGRHEYGDAVAQLPTEYSPLLARSGGFEQRTFEGGSP